MTLKKTAKDQRERQILLGLVELYLESGQPIGSETLREKGFNHISSATIRNYFSKMEKAGFLRQQHSSGGRIPTEAAYQLYIEENIDKPRIKNKQAESIRKKLSQPTREIATYLQKASEAIANESQCAVFLSSPRFDQDFILDIKVIEIDPSRMLCVLITDFGMVHTETLYIDRESSDPVNVHTLSQYLQWRISGTEKPDLSRHEERLGSQLYKEIMLRHIVTYSNFSAEDIYKTGFSKLLAYPDFNNAAALASGLSLFENESDLRYLLRKSCEKDKIHCLLGDDLAPLATTLNGCSILLIPYKIHHSIAGAIALLGPNCLPYRDLFGILHTAQEVISETLTNSLYKFKITYRKPTPSQIQLESKNPSFNLLIEDKKEEE